MQEQTYNAGHLSITVIVIISCATKDMRVDASSYYILSQSFQKNLYRERARQAQDNASKQQSKTKTVLGRANATSTEHGVCGQWLTYSVQNEVVAALVCF